MITTGRIVLYMLTQQNADYINERRKRTDNPYGGNYAHEGDVVPMIAVTIWPNEYGDGVPGVNGQVFLDGNDNLWITSAAEGITPGTWHWPNR